MVDELEEGLAGANKALKLIHYLEELEILPEEVNELVDHYTQAENTHGLIWGNIANFHREIKGIALMGLLCRILRDVEGWKADEQYSLAVVAANLKHTKEMVE